MDMTSVPKVLTRVIIVGHTIWTRARVASFREIRWLISQTYEGLHMWVFRTAHDFSLLHSCERSKTGKGSEIFGPREVLS